MGKTEIKFLKTNEYCEFLLANLPKYLASGKQEAPIFYFSSVNQRKIR
jgi:hypothetical protein